MRVLFVGAPIAPKTLPGLSPQQKFAATGENTGNLLIGQSIFEELDFTEHGYGMGLPPKEVNERFDVIVIGAANFIFKGFDLSSMADFIESTALPCVMVGLGAQMPAMGDSVHSIPEGSKRLLRVASHRSKTIGVRGHFTAEVMNGFGIRNVRAVGCPSLYRRLKRKFTIRRPTLGAGLRVSLNGSRNVIAHAASPEAAKRVEAQLLRLSLNMGYEYVLQNEKPEMNVLWSDDATRFVPNLQAIVKQFGLAVAPERLIEHIRSKNRLFLNLRDWDDYISRFDYSLGSRFHGNVIALTNGVAASILTHDSRTTEMARLMNIPHVPVEEIDKIDVEQLASSADYDAFEREYPLMYDRFAEFLDENGLQHNLVDARVDYNLVRGR